MLTIAAAVAAIASVHAAANGHTSKAALFAIAAVAFALARAMFRAGRQ